MNANPFIAIPDYPDFPSMTPDAARAALAQLLDTADSNFDDFEVALAKEPPTWDSVVTRLDIITRPVSEAWSLVSHLLSVLNSQEWRDVQEAFQPKIITFFLRVGQSRPLFEAFTKLKGTSLTPVRQRILDKAILSAKLSGVGLAGETQKHFNALQAEAAQLGMKFHNNLLDATKAFSLTLTKPEEIAGLPDSLLAVTAAQASGTPKAGPWKITLDEAVYIPFLKHSRNRAAREALYRARVSRASSGTLDNMPVIERLLALAQESAHILGYPNAAVPSLAVKTAKTVEAAEALIRQLAQATRPAAEREKAELEAFVPASARPLAPWDLAYWVERQRESKFNYDEEALSHYFPFEHVLKGLFGLARDLFGVTIEPDDGAVPVWHKDVRFFRVRDEKGALLASFYVDPYSRPENKSGGAWMNELKTRRRRPDGTLELPLALLACNQSVPVNGKPSLMRFFEVETIFHEFGHALQHMLTRIEDPDASGINGIEWDAVEVASQFMENWCLDRRTLRLISKHDETGACIPDSLIDRLVAAKNYQAASAQMRQLNFAALDLNLYAHYPNPKWPDALAVQRDCAARYSLFPAIPEDRFICSFGHIFGGGYAAGYYSYKWSEVMSADIFAAFEEAGLDNPGALREVGRRYRETFLALGGGTDPMEVFRRFRGRDPSIQPLLRHAGLA